MADATCSVTDDSHSPGPLTRDMCTKHYKRVQRHGDPYVTTRGTPEERFWRHVDKNGPVPEHRPDLGPCWLWTAAKQETGYGCFNDGTRLTGAHRFAYELLVGPIPSDLHIDHLCRNPSCVNAAGGHLEPVTQRENTLRGTGPAAVNATLTHCKNGHEFTEENTYIKTGRNGKKMRECRACRRKPREEWLTQEKNSKTHCINGHEFTPENTWIAPGSGQRYCRTCQKASRERSKARKAHERERP